MTAVQSAAGSDGEFRRNEDRIDPTITYFTLKVLKYDICSVPVMCSLCLCFESYQRWCRV